MKSRWLDILLIALLILLPIAFHWRVLTPNAMDRGSFPQGDFAEQFYAFAKFASDEMSHGQLPLWNPYTYAGHPFIADVQSAVFYPPALLVMFAAWWLGGFSLYALEWQAVLHFSLAGVFTYWFARREFARRTVDEGAWSVAVRRLAAVLSAVVFTFGGYLTSYPSQQLAVLETDVWLPLILLCLSIAGHRMPSAVVAAGMFFGIALLAGHPQSALYVLLVSAAYLFVQTREQHVRWREILMQFTLMLLVALGVAAVQWIPSLEFMSLSSRSTLTYADYARGFELQDPLQMLLPGSVSAYSPLYIGIAPLALVVCALWLTRRVARMVWCWLALAGFALALSFGGNLFVYPILYAFVPGFQLFRQQERAAFIFSFALALLSGYGALALAQVLPRDMRQRLRGLLRLSVGACVGAALLFVLIYFLWMQFQLAPDSPFRAASDHAAWLVLMLALVSGVLWLRVRGRLKRAPLLVALIVISTLDLFTVNWHTNFQPTPPEAQTRAPDFLAPIKADQVVFDPAEAENPIFRTYNEYRVFGNFGDLFQFEDTWGASPLRLARYDEFAKLPMQRQWALLNVKYVITWRQSLADLGLQSEIAAQQKVSDTETTYVHRLLNVSPRAVVVTQVERVATETELQTRLAAADFEFTKRALVTTPVSLHTSGDVVGTAIFVAHLPDFYLWDVHAPSDALFILSENDYPGWHAFIQGKEAPIIRANGIMLGVLVPAGESVVVFKFDPFSVKLGAAISGLTLAGLLVGWFVVRLKRSNHATNEQTHFQRP